MTGDEALEKVRKPKVSWGLGESLFTFWPMSEKKRQKRECLSDPHHRRVVDQWNFMMARQDRAGARNSGRKGVVSH